MIINENIRRLRMEAGLSQEELGKQLGVTRQAVSKWEMGTTAPDISLLPQLNGSDALKNLDLAKIMELVHRGVMGNLVEIESEDGGIVKVFVE